MSKWYQVEVTTSKIFVVEVEDHEGEDDAVLLVYDELDGDVVEENTFQLLGKSEIEAGKRHADEILVIDEE